jgi:hypothetical protein
MIEGKVTDDGDILLGTGMLRAYQLEINFPKQTVQLRRVENTKAIR